MYTYLKNLAQRLAEDKKDMLRRIYAPVEVAVPLSDSRRDVCILPDGEIRAYGRLYLNNHLEKGGQTAYLSSVDCGLSWEIRYAPGIMNSCTYLEKGGVYLTSVDGNYYNLENGSSGLYVYRSTVGPDDPNPQRIKVSDDNTSCSFLPQQSAYTNRVWFTSQYGGHNPVFFYSDDLGLTWERREITLAYDTDPVFPHKGLRWCVRSGSEPYAVELSENKMIMILRTATDCFYQSFSYDGGDTWTPAEPSTFYGSNTTPFLLRLTDGRVLAFWNNTHPLPMPNHEKINGFFDPSTADGRGESAFTNRDAAHVAITADGGDSWTGYRELLLNSKRNNADFRYIGGVASSFDKSVHQFQAYELPFNKILVSAGQNTASRRLVIFDLDWLYETSRKEDFLSGLVNLTTHTYVKSISGHSAHLAGNGHCAWNRTYSAYLLPDPDENCRESLYVCKHHDERLYNDIGGMCWNFPASKQGTVTVDLRILEKQARFILADRWYNTCDAYAAQKGNYWFEIDRSDLENGAGTVSIEYDTELSTAKVSINGKHLFRVALSRPCPTGISYLLLQCATDGDSEGFFVRSMEKK